LVRGSLHQYASAIEDNREQNVWISGHIDGGYLEVEGQDDKGRPNAYRLYLTAAEVRRLVRACAPQAPELELYRGSVLHRPRLDREHCAELVERLSR
jgi:hypothetical protein